jgi:hypothetical protein
MMTAAEQRAARLGLWLAENPGPHRPNEFVPTDDFPNRQRFSESLKALTDQNLVKPRSKANIDIELTAKGKRFFRNRSDEPIKQQKYITTAESVPALRIVTDADIPQWEIPHLWPTANQEPDYAADHRAALQQALATIETSPRILALTDDSPKQEAKDFARLIKETCKANSHIDLHYEGNNMRGFTYYSFTLSLPDYEYEPEPEPEPEQETELEPEPEPESAIVSRRITNNKPITCSIQNAVLCWENGNPYCLHPSSDYKHAL